MATVRLYVGQCGNQVGRHLSERLFQHEEEDVVVSSSSGYKSSTKEGYSREILVDSEGKVLTNRMRRMQKTNSLRVRGSNIITGKIGRGNNWALGYQGHSSEPLCEQTLECLRKEAERCDMFSNLLLVHSLCGGTGGGLGSRVLEEARDLYPTQHLISNVVAPYSSGDTPLQYYNALLSLTSMQKFSDAVFLFKNDSVQTIACGGNEKVSLAKMNQYIASTISSLILPTDTLTPKNGCSINLEPSEIVRVVCPQPSTKFLTAYQITQRNVGISAMCSSLIGYTKREVDNFKCHTISSILVSRGSEAGTCMEHLDTLERKIKKNLNSVAWNPFPVDIWTCARKLSRTAELSQTTLVSNYSSIIPFCVNVWNRAREMYQSKAYLHWYNKYGVNQDYFDESFDTVEEIVSSYKTTVA